MKIFESTPVWIAVCAVIIATAAYWPTPDMEYTTHDQIAMGIVTTLCFIAGFWIYDDWQRRRIDRKNHANLVAWKLTNAARGVDGLPPLPPPNRLVRR